jgi:MFS family permease
MKKKAKGISLNQTKLTVLIQFLNSFVGGVLFIALPLLMNERIDIATIGLIFSCLPIIFQLTRMLFAIISDFLGRKLFFVLNGFLNILSSSIYYLAYTPLQFLIGKVTEGTTGASLWAVNRAFLLEDSGRERKPLVHLRTSVYVSMAVGILLAGVLITWFSSYMETLLLCILVGAAVIPMSSFLTDRKERRGFSKKRVLSYLDLRKKEKMFTMFLILFFVMGMSFGFKDGYVFPLFLEKNEFKAEAIGVCLGIQMLLAGFSSHLFARRIRIDKLILLSGFLYSLLLIILGFSSYLFAAFLVIVFGVVEGLLVGGQEGILLNIAKEESYGTDIGLLTMGLHAGRTASLALSGFLIALWGFAAPFLLSALVFPIFYISAYFFLK